MSPVPHELSESFRKVLEREFTSRRTRRPSYSLRQYARSIGIDPSNLQKILNGQRKLGKSAAEKLIERLPLEPSEKMRLFAKSVGRPDARKLKSKNFQNLEEDRFAVIADWWHYGILEYLSLESSVHTPQGVSKALGISSLEAKEALDRLVRVNLLSMDPDTARYADQTEGFTSTLSVQRSGEAFRKLQKQILELAIRAMDSTPYSARDQSSMTMAFDPEKMEEVRALIKNFRRKLCSYADKQEKKSVYQLSISFFPVVP